MLAAGTRRLFPLKSEVTYLDHGGFGLTPVAILDYKKQCLNDIEAAPRAFDMDYPAKWQAMRAAVAWRFKLHLQDVTLTDNASDGVIAVLRSLTFKEGDEILITSLAYGAVRKAVHHFAVAAGAKVIEVPLDFAKPDTGPFVEALKQALTPRTKLAVLDNITSKTALVMPLAEMIAVCREQGVPVLVDGAHAPGHIALDITALGADWYAGNLHKWCFVPRGCGFLWAAPQHHVGLLPNVLSWETDQPFPNNFSWTGTRDASSLLSIEEAFRFIDRLGEDNIRRHNHQLAMSAADFLNREFGSTRTVPESMIGNMALVCLPDLQGYKATEEGAAQLQRTLWETFHIAVPAPLAANGRLWLRISAQIYNETGDYEKLVQAIKAL